MWRERGRLAALALLVAIIGAVSLTAAAGARRADSAFGRFAEVTAYGEGFVNVEELIVQGEMSAEHALARLARIGALPEVDGVAPYAVMGVSTKESSVGVAFVGTDARFGTTVSVPIVLAGRAPDPARSDEIAVNEVLAHDLGIGAGERITLATIADFETNRPGPEIDATVTGIVRAPFDFINEGGGLVYPTTAFYRVFGEQVHHSVGFAVVDLTPGADAAAFDAGVRHLFGDAPEVVVQAGFDGGAPGQDAIGVQVIALLVAAAVVAMGGCVVIAQWVARTTSNASPDVEALRSIGTTRRQRTAAIVLVHAPFAAAGAVLAGVSQVLASPLMPVGYARRLEPNPGVDVDWAVLAIGLVALVTVVLVMATAFAWRIAGPRGVTSSQTRAGRHARLFRVLPLPVALGLTAGTGGRRGDGTASGRLAGVVAATGLVAALVVGAGMERVIESPARYGWNWDGEVVVDAADDRPGSASDLRDASDRIAADPEVEASAIAAYSDAIELAGVSVPAFGVEPVTGSLELTVVQGGLPHSPDELVLGREAMLRLSVAIGDHVAALGADGSRRELRVVGQAVFPVIADNSYSNTAGLTLAGLERLDAKTPEYRHLIRVVPGASIDDLLERFEHLGSPNRPVLPTEILNLRSVDGYPRLLATGFAVLATLGVAHALSIGVRERRRDLAVLRALGFVPSQVRATIRWWAVAVSGLGLGLGIIFGTLVGGRAWGYLADRLGVANDPSVPFRTTGLVAAAAVIIAISIAVLPALSATRSTLAALRAE